jgi:hypothetical protein
VELGTFSSACGVGVALHAPYRKIVRRPHPLASIVCYWHVLGMPTIFRSGPYRFFIFAADGAEPPHVHVERDANRAKFWLKAVRLQESGGFGRAELNRILTLVEENREYLLKAWNEFFGN